MKMEYCDTSYLIMPHSCNRIHKTVNRQHLQDKSNVHSNYKGEGSSEGDFQVVGGRE